MKTFTEEVWFETNKDGTISVGFTQDYIRRKMPECFHVVQADVKNVSKDTPMLVIETNDCLESVKAPITGRVKYFNHKARDFPDQLKEDDVILTVAPPGVAEEVAVAAKPKVVNWDDVQAMNLDWLNEINPAPRGV